MDTALITDNILKSQAFKLKGRIFTLTVLQILDEDASHIDLYLSEVIQKAPRMFENAPVVLDFTAVESATVDIKSICQCLRRHGLIPLAIQGGETHLQTLALANGLGILGRSSMQDKPLIPEDNLLKPETAETIKTKLLTSPVRSGQQVVSLGGDLVVVSSVGHGSELLAEGNIHVYGALRGRALAGIDGNRQARIFCQVLDAELVSIAGYYKLRDEIEPPPGPCQIYLEDETICIDAL
jgi:septum site-determining protein MinC